jgi:hypothetical protein
MLSRQRRCPGALPPNRLAWDSSLKAPSSPSFLLFACCAVSFPRAAPPLESCAGAPLLIAECVGEACGRARRKAGMPGFRFNDLRHRGQTLAASTGTTTKYLMRRLGLLQPGRLFERDRVQARDTAKSLSEAMTCGVVATGGASGVSAGGGQGPGGTMEVPTLTIFCREGRPPADDILAYCGCPQPVPS